jgi:type I restriction enzyme M protein
VQFDYLVALPDSEDSPRAIIEAMESIEGDYDNLRGLLPKSEYQELDNDVLGQLLYTLNPDELAKYNESLTQARNLLLLRLMNGEVAV